MSVLLCRRTLAQRTEPADGGRASLLVARCPPAVLYHQSVPRKLDQVRSTSVASPTESPRLIRYETKPIMRLIEACLLGACGPPYTDSTSARALRRSHKMPDLRLQLLPTLT